MRGVTGKGPKPLTPKLFSLHGRLASWSVRDSTLKSSVIAALPKYPREPDLRPALGASRYNTFITRSVEPIEHVEPTCRCRCDEWHLDSGKPFGHHAFHLGAWLGQPAIMVASVLSHARFVAIGSVGDSMGDEDIK